jgi:hypothetical protein
MFLFLESYLEKGPIIGGGIFMLDIPLAFDIEIVEFLQVTHMFLNTGLDIIPSFSTVPMIGDRNILDGGIKGVLRGKFSNITIGVKVIIPTTTRLGSGERRQMLLKAGDTTKCHKSLNFL